MHPEAAFLAGYAIVLLAIATGVESLGRRPTQPWAAKMLAACRAPDQRRVDDETDWPHSEVPVFHLGLSGVVLAAALLLTAASVARHHQPIELVVQVALLGLITRRIVRLITRHRIRPVLPSGSGPRLSIGARRKKAL